METLVVKSDGSKESFNINKIKESLIKSGADNQTVNLALSKLDKYSKKFKNFISSEEIYNLVLNHLKSEKPDIALKYKLKRAIMDLGPTGYVFEKYIAKILNEYGFDTKVSQIISGFCVDHEVDVVARKDGVDYMIECKYHNDLAISSDIKTALYVHSRFEDIKKACLIKNNGYNFKEGWLVTNTKVTTDVIKYMSCVKMKVIAWHYPEKENLEYFIEKKNLYPISILDGLNSAQKNILYDRQIITIKDILNVSFEQLNKAANISSGLFKKIVLQAQMLYI